MNIAIIGCKKHKQSYQCSGREMYSKSKTFRSQLEFCELVGYNNIYIYSIKYGLVGLDDVIEPYDLTLGNTTVMSPNIASNEHVKIVSNSVYNQLNGLNGRVHFHTPTNYYNTVKNDLTCIHKHIPQQRQTTQTGVAYQQAIDEYKNSGDLKKSISIISFKPKMNRPKEPNQMWYHPTYEPIYGKHTDVIKQYPDVNLGTAYKVLMSNMGIIIGKSHTHHVKGWHLDNTLEFYKLNENFRLKRDNTRERM